MTGTLEDHLVAAGRGDEAAFAELFTAVAPRVHGLTTRLIRDPAEAEEVTQEVLLQVWTGSAAFDPARGSALAWIMTIAHRRAVDRVRSTSAARRRDLAHAQDSTPAPSDVTAAEVDRGLDAELLRAAMLGLSPTQRRAIELAYFAGHTVQEIARMTEVPLGTAKGRIRDGLHRLRRSLEPSPAG